MDNVIDFINVNRDRYLDELKALLAIPSISALPQHKDDVRKTAEWSAEEMRRIGLQNVRLIETPGHTPQDITTLVGTAGDVVALTHLWWTEEGPADDPYSSDRAELRQQRERVLDLATLIVPGHGAPFRPGSSTPR